MATHKFLVGQTLHFSPGLNGDRKSRGRYKVVRHLPETGGILQYRITSTTNIMLRGRGLADFPGSGGSSNSISSTAVMETVISR